MKSSVKLAFLAVAALALGLAGSVHAQAPKKNAAPAPQATPAAPATPPADATAPPVANWAARCGSVSRSAPLECAIEQNAILTKTGQLVVLINIRVPSDTRVPAATIQLPLGLNLPGGAQWQVDDGKATDLQIQTCEQRGCYASIPLAPDFLAAMKTGKELKVSFQNLAKETISIPMPLTDFAAAYDKIK